MSYYTNATEVKHISTIRATYPNMSIPYGADLSDIGWYAIEPVDRPAPETGFTVVEGAPEQYAPEKWRQTWVLQAQSPVPVPESVSPRQIRQALTRAGLRASVESAVAAGDQDTKDWYEFATTFDRSNPVVAAIGAALNVSAAQLDELWILADSL